MSRYALTFILASCVIIALSHAAELITPKNQAQNALDSQQISYLWKEDGDVVVVSSRKDLEEACKVINEHMNTNIVIVINHSDKSAKLCSTTQ